MEEWLTVAEAATFLGVATRTVFHYVQQGKLTAYKTGMRGRTLLKRDELEALRQPRPVRRNEVA